MEYLTRAKSAVAHIWDGADTLCRMWSTGGPNRRKAWVVVRALGERRICMNCQNPRLDEQFEEALARDVDPEPRPASLHPETLPHA